jgi:ketosteroid isomerase-like protein
MKRCLNCNRVYEDDTLNFCLDDGAALVFGPNNDAIPTVVIAGSTGRGTVEELLFIERQFAAAWLANDPSAHRQYLANSWSQIGASGEIIGKTEFLENAFSGDVRLVSLEQDEVRVRDHGTFAIVTGRTHAAFSVENESRQLTIRFTDVFCFSEGQWQCVASHNSGVGS